MKSIFFKSTPLDLTSFLDYTLTTPFTRRQRNFPVLEYLLVDGGSQVLRNSASRIAFGLITLDYIVIGGLLL